MAADDIWAYASGTRALTYVEAGDLNFVGPFTGVGSRNAFDVVDYGVKYVALVTNNGTPPGTLFDSNWAQLVFVSSASHQLVLGAGGSLDTQPGAGALSTYLKVCLNGTVLALPLYALS